MPVSRRQHGELLPLPGPGAGDLPLAQLGIEDEALAQWLDQISRLYHFPWRDYAAGLAPFTQTDPIPTEDSPYSAFDANPVNDTDETGGMWGN